VHDLQVEPGVRLNVQAHAVPHQPVPACPRRPPLIAVCRQADVVGGEVVAVGQRQQRDPDHRDASGVQPPHHARTLVAEVRAHQRDPRLKRQQITDDRGLREQGRKPGRIQLARKRQLRRRKRHPAPTA
jgi:hypothetical protein